MHGPEPDDEAIAAWEGEIGDLDPYARRLPAEQTPADDRPDPAAQFDRRNAVLAAGGEFG